MSGPTKLYNYINSAETKTLNFNGIKGFFIKIYVQIILFLHPNLRIDL